MPELGHSRSSLKGLRRFWSDRDERYARWKYPLSPAQVAAIRAWRAEEAQDVFPVADVEMGVTEARRWLPPQERWR